MVGAIDRIVHSWHDIPVRDVLSVGDMDRNHHGGEFLGFGALLPAHHHSHSAFTHGKKPVSLKVHIL
jgi:hypothetical protein